MTLPKTWYPTQDSLVANGEPKNRCSWFYTNNMKTRADRNNQKIKIRKIRNAGHYVEITS